MLSAARLIFFPHPTLHEGLLAKFAARRLWKGDFFHATTLVFHVRALGLVLKGKC